MSSGDGKSLAENHTDACDASATAKSKTPARIDNAATPKEGLMTELKKLSRLNGEINRMTKEELCSQLSKLSMDVRGTKDILKRRLKDHYKRQKLSRAYFKESTRTYYDYLLVIDFEATCEMTNPPKFVHEIIEFPAVLLCTHNSKVAAEFHRYCRPVRNPKLTEFCKKLTGITQEQVEAADVFAVVLTEFEEWLRKHELGTRHRYAVVTDGPWDMCRFLLKQCELDKIPFPKFGKKWINIRKVYSNFYNCKRVSLANMLEYLGLAFEGRQHCGLDDARNIARVASHLLSDGANLKVNERMHENRAASSQKTRRRGNGRRQGGNRSEDGSSEDDGEPQPNCTGAVGRKAAHNQTTLCLEDEASILGVDPCLDDTIETLRMLKVGDR